MEPWHRLDLAGQDEARTLLRMCCGSRRWVDRMLASRPFASRARMLAAAREIWSALSVADWREAFGHHPRIGDRDALRRRVANTRHLSSKEQAGVNGAPEDVLTALADGNRAYEEKFGYIFIVCASGRSAEEMLKMLQARLGNPPDAEITIAAGEQAKITELRLLQL